LSALYRPRKTTPATIEYLDLAGMEKGEAAQVLPLDQLRTVDALAHVVRAFRDPAIPHVEGSVDPARDVATMETELILADHPIAERRVE
jgi:ribosome-binding ATPase YchF (GTP1/OBG family)